MATLILERDQLHQVRAGDRIVAIDDYRPTRALTVEAPLGVTPVPGIKTVAPAGSRVEHYLYPDIVWRSVTVERPALAARQRNHRTGARVFRRYALPLVQPRPGGPYVTEDGRYEISYNDDFATTCDAAHPVRLAGGAGYYCPGARTHHYGRWVIWDNTRQDFLAIDQGDGYTSLAGAAEAVAQQYL
ncbi:hypothetical protein ACFFMN_23935 [Planobispora siamensis]|uniref:Uncharacterized protein n=1 Tax=Planobispora siamensis TaxID=936338 RepID=A0A8J3WMV8_9ACTN|nr:hypothetical protein [Planobispora siamensis]GIH95388.1 hypothetical protein Psi01_60180 [Planobispora siamensis]